MKFVQNLRIAIVPRTVLSRVARQRPLEDLAATGFACWPSMV